MKTKSLPRGLVFIVITGLLTVTTLSGYAQKWTVMMDSTRRGSCDWIPNLTADQQKKMDDLRVKHLKEVTPLRNELNEKYAHLQTLEDAEKPDMEGINKTIDEITSIKAKLMKKSAAHRNDIKTILTDEQRVYLNARDHRMGGGHRMGRGHGMGKESFRGREGMMPDRCMQK